MSDREDILLRSMTETTWKFYLWVGCLMAVACFWLYAHLDQLDRGLVVTGQGDQISWGICIINFVFFLSISIAGTLISAVLRLTNAGWRQPITRMAEAITLTALFVGPPIILLDLGRPDRMLYLFRYARIQSPIIWDVMVINTYLVGCVIYFYLLLVPDLVLLAARPELPAWRRRLYQFLSAGWKGKENQLRRLEKSISIMSVTLLPLAILTHTVLAWIFATTLRPGWNSSIFGTYFVIGAIYGGCAVVILSMYVLRRLFHLEDYLEPAHFRNVGLLLLTFTLLYLYFNFNEYLTIGYSSKNADKVLIKRLLSGEDAPLFWSVNILGVIVPILLLGTVLIWKRYKGFIIPAVALASGLAVVGAWAKRYLIVVPTLSSPFLPAQGLRADWTHYSPTWAEWALTAAAFAAFLLIYTFLSKLFPIVSIWETREKETGTMEKIIERVIPAVRPQPFMPPPLGVVLIAAILISAVSVRAEEAPADQKPNPTKSSTMVAEWAPLPPPETAAASPDGRADSKARGSRRVYFYALQALSPLLWGGKGKSTEEEPYAIRPLAISAKLLDDKGAPLAYQPVGFALETSFGTLLQYGRVPTDGDGRAKLVLREHRCGTYPMQVNYEGNQDFRVSSAQLKVDFGPCSAPALPAEGVLIAPYASAPITLGAALLFGTVWGIFIYAFGYLFFWRTRHGEEG